MNSLTQTISLSTTEALIDKLSGEYLNGEFAGATGGKPDPNFWASSDYRAGYLAGTEDYFNRKFAAA